MAANALVQTRIDADVRDRASAVLENMDLTVSDAVRILLTRTANEGTLPLELISTGEAHDAWFRAKVLQALGDTPRTFLTKRRRCISPPGAPRPGARPGPLADPAYLVRLRALRPRRHLHPHRGRQPKGRDCRRPADCRRGSSSRRVCRDRKPRLGSGDTRARPPGTSHIAAYAAATTSVHTRRILHGAKIWPDHFPESSTVRRIRRYRRVGRKRGRIGTILLSMASILPARLCRCRATTKSAPAPAGAAGRSRWLPLRPIPGGTPSFFRRRFMAGGGVRKRGCRVRFGPQCSAARQGLSPALRAAGGTGSAGGSLPARSGGWG